MGFFDMLGGMFSSGMNMISQDQTNEANKQLARENMQWQQQENERAFQRDLYMWDLQNQYNSPAAQRERIEAAGLNPQLAFSNGVSATSGNATSAPNLKPAQAITPEMRAYTGWNLGQSGIDDWLLRRKIANKDIQLKDEDINLRKAQTIAQLLSNDITEEQRPYALEAIKLLVDERQQNVVNLKQTHDIREEHRLLDIQAKQLQNKFIQSKTELNAQELINQGIKEQQMRLNLSFEKATYNYRIASLILDNTLKRHNIALTKNQCSKVLAETANLVQTHDINAYWEAINRDLGTRDPNKSMLSQFANQLIVNGFDFLDAFTFDWTGLNGLGERDTKDANPWLGTYYEQ